jgi:uncharacterized membrane protein
MQMHKSRIEAFSDGVMAIIITIMVLELRVPQGAELSDLLPLAAVGLCYVLSFLYLAIFWSNHHHLFQTVNHVNGRILWANIHLLFWLSLVPFVTAWAGEHSFARIPTVLYGFVLFMAASAYLLLTKMLIAYGNSAVLADALGKDFKTKISVALYAIAVPMAYWYPIPALAIYSLVALLWIVPDTRIEKKLQH